MEAFHCDTRILSGEGSLERLRELGSRRLLVVTDPFFLKNGVARQAAEASGAEAWVEQLSLARNTPKEEKSE